MNLTAKLKLAVGRVDFEPSPQGRYHPISPFFLKYVSERLDDIESHFIFIGKVHFKVLLGGLD